jgi:hypothetical protein
MTKVSSKNHSQFHYYTLFFYTYDLKAEIGAGTDVAIGAGIV